MVSIKFEQDAIDNLKSDLLLLNSDKIFLVTGKKSYVNSGAKEIIKSLEDDFQFIRFKDFEENPNIVDVEKGVQLFKENNCNCIIAIGGGSAIDMAKLIKFFSPKTKPFIGKFKNHLSEKENIPLVAIPTTAGTGSEATHFAVLYVGIDKFSISDKLLLPNHISIISKLHHSQTSYQKAVSGIDAFSQAIESFWSINSTKESREYSLQALKLITPNLPKIISEKENVEAYKKMALGAYLAGKAINIAKTTAPHAYSYYLTKRFNIPHGHAVAIYLPLFINYNLYLNNSVRDLILIKKLDQLIKVLKNVLPKSNKSSLDYRVRKFIESIGLNIDLEDLNISNEDFILSLKSGNQERLKNNPRKIYIDQFLKETYTHLHG
jgi:alcohol dehydrogenase class IV